MPDADLGPVTEGPALLRSEDHRRVPWRNGRGTTWEVAAAPAPPASGDAAFGWRLSFAEVVGRAPFSAFPGVDRTITLVEGGPLRLTVEGVDRELEQHVPFAFAGEAQVESVAATPSTDLNVMVLRGRVAAAVTTHVLESSLTPLVIPAGGEVLVVVLDGTAAVATGPWSAVARARDVVRLTGQALEVAGAAVIQVVRLSGC